MFNFFDGLIEAASKLKKAVPLMVKYRVAPNPMNYSIWYNYVSGTIPEMNRQLDSVIEQHGTCPPTIAESIFKTYLSDHARFGAMDRANDGLSAVALDMKNKSLSLKSSVQVYEQVLTDALSCLKSPEKDHKLQDTVLELVDKTSTFLEDNVTFQFELDDAQRKIKRLQDDLDKAREESYTDPLTNIYNRRYFDKRLNSIISDKPKSPYCLILADIDNFKNINDTYGHPLGDEVIRRMGEIISHFGDETCVPARLGGEEFALLVPKMGMIDALATAEKMRVMVSKLVIKSRRNPEIRCTLTSSFGVTQFKPGDNAVTLVERADKALYKAKQEGKDRVAAL